MDELGADADWSVCKQVMVHEQPATRANRQVHTCMTGT